jgi:hypothetical protein
MGLSNEKPANTAVIDEHLFALETMRVKRLTSQLLKYEHSPDPREAANPSHGVRIRKIVPIRPHVDTACADHNSRVSSLGDVEQWEHTWKGRA